MSHRYQFSSIRPTDYYGTTIAAYFNLRYQVFSVKQGSKYGNLLSHCKSCKISNAVFDDVFIIGTLENLSWEMLSDNEIKKLGYKQVICNLRLDRPEFHLKGTSEYIPVTQSSSVILSGKTVWVKSRASWVLL